MQHLQDQAALAEGLSNATVYSHTFVASPADCSAQHAGWQYLLHAAAHCLLQHCCLVPDLLGLLSLSPSEDLLSPAVVFPCTDTPALKC